MIIEGIVTKLEVDQTKKVYIEVRLNRILAICFDGDALIDDQQPYYFNLTNKFGPNHEFLQRNQDFYTNFYQFNIVGFIRKHDVNQNKE